MTIKTRIKIELYFRLFKKLWFYYAIFFLTLATIAYVYGNPVGIGFLFVSFTLFRYHYDGGLTYHKNTVKSCIAFSCFVFALAGFPLIIFHINISLFACIPIAILITWFSWLGGKYQKQEKDLIALKVKPFDIDNCTESELRQRCTEKLKTHKETLTERAILHFVKKEKHENIDISVKQSQRERERLRKLLK